MLRLQASRLPALSIIHGFFLLTVFVYLHFRRPQRPSPRQASYQAFEGLQEALDRDLDLEEAARIEDRLAIAKNSDRDEIVSLASALSGFLQTEKQHLPEAEPGHWERAETQIDRLGRRLGRGRHRAIISVLLILWVALAIGYIVVLVQEGTNLASQVVQWREPLIVIQAPVGTLMVVAIVAWLAQKQELGLRLAVSGFLLSLVALQTLYFYLSQFSALASTLPQLLFLLVLLTYRRWYLRDQSVAT